MKKTILSIILALVSSSPVLAAQAVPQGQQPEQKDSVKIISFIAFKPVYDSLKDFCEGGGGSWVQGEKNNKALAWACRNSAGQFGSIGLPEGSKGAPLAYLVVTNASEANKTVSYRAFADGYQVIVTASLVKPTADGNQ